MSEASIDPLAVCLTRNLGTGVIVGAFSRIGEEVEIGNDTLIGSGAVVPNGVTIGAGVVIEDGAVLAPGMTVGEGAKIGTGVVFAAQRVTGGDNMSDRDAIRVGAHCVVGPNATVCAGIRLGHRSIVDAGSVVTRSAQPFSMVAGNPATVVGFSGASGSEPDGENELLSRDREGEPWESDSKVRGVKTFHLPFISDPRGNLTVGEFGKSLPFSPKRFFVTFNVPSAHLRGEHAHRKCDQLLVCVSGSCALVVDDGENREEFLLDEPTFGVLVPRMTWATEYKHSEDSVLLVFASDYYDPEDYLRDYQEFIELTGSTSI